MRISELAEQVGVATSTVRYYERIGLLAPPDRTPSGYRDYDDAAAARLLFVSRARRMGLSCPQIAELLGWARRRRPDREARLTLEHGDSFRKLLTVRASRPHLLMGTAAPRHLRPGTTCRSRAFGRFPHPTAT